MPTDTARGGNVGGLEVRAGDTGVLYLAGEFDLACERDFDAALAMLGADHGSVTLDLSELTFMNSSALHSIAKLARHRRVTLRRPRSIVLRLLAVTGFDRRERIRVEP